MDKKESKNQKIYTCPMHPEVKSAKPGRCTKCGMDLIEVRSDKSEVKSEHKGHQMKSTGKMSFWEKFKMGLTMTMGMEHGGIAGREMAKIMEEDIKFKFFFALIFTGPIVYFSLIKPNPWLALILTTPVFFYSGWIFLYSTVKALQAKTLNMAVL